MNRKLKSLLAMVCVLALTLAMSVCAFAADTVTEDEAANYKSAAETLISQIAGFSDEEIENLHRMMHLPRRPWSPGKV